MPASLLADVKSHRAGVNRNRLHVEDDHVVSIEVTDRRDQRIVVKMLVVDHVVLHLVDDLSEVVHLENEHSVFLEHLVYSSGYSLNVGYVGVDVVRDHHVRLAIAIDDLRGDLLGEEIVYDCNPRIVDRRDDIGRGVDTDHRANPLIGQRPQQNAVIAAELYHRGLRRVQKP